MRQPHLEVKRSTTPRELVKLVDYRLRLMRDRTRLKTQLGKQKQGLILARQEARLVQLNEELIELNQHIETMYQATLVLQILRGEITTAKAARQHNLTPAEIESWQHTFLEAGTNGFRTNPNDK